VVIKSNISLRENLIPIGALGLGSVYGWFWCVFFSTGIFVLDTGHPAVFFNALMVWLLGLVFSNALGWVFPQAFEMIVSTKWIFPVAVLGGMGTLAIAFGQTQSAGLSEIYIYPSAFMSAVVKSVMGFAWGDAYSRSGLRTVRVMAALSQALAALLFLIVPKLAFGASIVVTTLLPMLSAVLLWCYHLTVSGSVVRVAESKRPVRLPRAFCLYIFIGAIANNYLRGLNITGSSPQQSFAVEILFASIILLGILFSYSKPQQMTIVISSLLIIGGLTLLAFHLDWGAALVAPGFVCLEIFTWVLLADFSQRNRAAPIIVIAQSWFAISMGLLVGTIIGALVFEYGLNTVYGSIASTILAFMTLVSLLATFRWPFLSQFIERESTLSIENSYDSQCMIVARRFGLSPRETEVLMLLAYGRDITFVEKSLFISRNTAKAHIKHIYAKVGVRSRQALLDIIENVGKDGEYDRSPHESNEKAP
jgi:DNA-binding CsgD family transcriptional regulator